MDELKERKALEQGSRAQGLLDNPLFEEILGGLESEYVRYWRENTTVDDTAGRERLWQAVQIVGKVRNQLKQFAADGRIAEASLQSLRQGGKP